MDAACFLPRWPAGSVNELTILMRAAGQRCRLCASMEELLAALDEGCRLLVVSHEETAAIETFSRTVRDGLIIALLDRKFSETISPMQVYLPVGCFMAVNDFSVHPGELVTILAKFRSRDIFGLQKYMNPNVHLRHGRIHNPADKERVIEEICDDISHVGGAFDDVRFSEYSRRVALTVDELLVNAIFHGNPRLARQQLGTPFALSPDEAVEVSWGYDGEVFGFVVRDPYGTLSKEVVLKKLTTPTLASPQKGAATAGIGLRLVFEYVHSLVINSHPGFCTEIVGLLKFDRLIRVADQRLRSFQYFTVA